MNAVSSQRQGFKRRAGLPREQDREATQEHNGPVEGQGLSALVSRTSSTVVQWHKRCSTAAALTAVASSGAVCRPTNTMARHDTTAADSAHKHHTVRPARSSLASGVYGFYTSLVLPSNAKPQDAEGEFTRFTDFTANRMRVYVTPARLRSRPRSRSLGLIPAPLSRDVKTVKPVKPQDGRGVFSPPCRKTGCKFYGSAVTEVAG